MEIEIFTLSDFAQDNNSKLTIVGTFDSIQSRQFPCTHPAFTVACRLRFAAKEAGVHGFRLRVINAEGKEILEPVGGEITIPNPPNGQFAAINLITHFNQLRFDAPGRYSFELYIDDDWKSGLPLLLNLVK
jgi:hypothetical protein